MQEYFTIISNFGFPVAVASYLLFRFEKKLEDLEAEVEASRNSDNGFNSTIPRARKASDKLLPDEEEVVSIAREQGLPEERVQEALKSFREKKGRL